MEGSEAASALWARPAEIPTGEFTTLSYNVAGLPQEVSAANPKDHIPLISPLLNDYDFVLTQEDFDWWQKGLGQLDFVHYHERLRARVDHPYRSGRHPGPAAVGLAVATQRPFLQVGDGLGLLSRFPFENLTRVPWKTVGPSASDGLAMKGFSMARVELVSGVSVDLYNLHADAGGEAPDKAAREAGFEQLAAWIEERSAGHAVILGGDTNLHTEADAGHPEDAQVWRAFLERTGLRDVWEALGTRDHARIDKFAFRSGGGVELMPLSGKYEAEKFRDAAGGALSDHEALAVRWRWSGPAR